MSMMDRTVRSDNRGIGDIRRRRQASRLITLSLCCFLILLVNGLFLANTAAVTARSWYTDTRFAVTPDRRIVRERSVPSLQDYPPYGPSRYGPSAVPGGSEPGGSAPSGGSGYSPNPYDPGSDDRDSSTGSSSRSTSRSTSSSDSGSSSGGGSSSYRRFGR